MKGIVKAIGYIQLIFGCIGGIVCLGTLFTNGQLGGTALLALVLFPICIIISCIPWFALGQLFDRVEELELQITHQASHSTKSYTHKKISQQVNQADTQVVDYEEDSEQIEEIQNRQYEKCTDIAQMQIPDGVTHIGEFAFKDCWNMTSITIPNSVTHIAASAFLNCSKLGKIVLPNGLCAINRSTFDHCASLKTIVIPNTITIIGYNAFNMCNSITDIYYTGTEEEWEDIAIDKGNSALTSATIHFNHQA